VELEPSASSMKSTQPSPTPSSEVTKANNENKGSAKPALPAPNQPLVSTYFQRIKQWTLDAGFAVSPGAGCCMNA
jgi:hypothetical protein